MTNARLAVAGLVLFSGGGRREIRRLFERTAAAFACRVPTSLRRDTKGLLAQYAAFTRDRAELALEDGTDLEALDRRLFGAAYALGKSLRARLGVHRFAESLSAARLIYRRLGIDFRGCVAGDIEVRRCAFSSIYSPLVCSLVSGLDRGLIFGLTAGGRLRFTRRLTEGAPECRGWISGGRE